MIWPRAALACVLLAVSGPAVAHLVGAPIDREAEVNLWHVDPVAVLLLLLTAWCYWRGSKIMLQRRRTNESRFARRRICFWAGWVSLAIALASPLDPLGELLFSAHMVQHELMMLVSAPFLVLSRPTSVLLRGSPRFIARSFGAIARRQSMQKVWAVALSPLGAWSIHAVGLWAWHLPVLFEAGLTNTWIHALQHFSFLVVALIFWWALMRPGKMGSAPGILYLFTTATHASLLGALLTFSPYVWYDPYILTAPQWGLTALEDQQMGGLIMWMPAGVVFIAAAMVSVARTLGDSEKRVRRREARLQRASNGV